MIRKEEGILLGVSRPSDQAHSPNLSLLPREGMGPARSERTDREPNIFRQVVTGRPHSFSQRRPGLLFLELATPQERPLHTVWELGSSKVLFLQVASTEVPPFITRSCRKRGRVLCQAVTFNLGRGLHSPCFLHGETEARRV